MELNREILLDKLTRYLDRGISYEDICQWALNNALDKDFGALAESDPFVHDVVVELLKLEEQPSLAPSRKILQKYRRCLSEGLSIPVASLARPSALRRFGRYARKIAVCVILFVLRLYVFVFGVCSFVINYLIIKQPEIFRTPENLRSFLEALKTYSPLSFYSFIVELTHDPQFPAVMEAVRPEYALLQIPMLHLIYAFLILLPTGWVVRNIIFSISFPLLGLGMMYYWYLTWDVSAKVAFTFMLQRAFAWLIVSPVTAVPATLALILLIIKTLQFQSLEER